MDQEGKSTVSWEAFDVCVSETFRNLISDTDFTDVTLVCEDDKQIDAHKVILSNASTFFRRILVRNPHQKPMLYLKGFSYEEVKSIIEFIYLGQTEVCQDNISRFISIAVDLEIKGIDKNIVGGKANEKVLGVDNKQSEEKSYLDEVFQDNSNKNYSKMDNEKGNTIKEREVRAGLKNTMNDFNCQNPTLSQLNSTKLKATLLNLG